MALSNQAKTMRKQFRDTYSQTTAEVIKALASGKNSSEAASRLNVPMRSVATTKGNLTRGSYYPYAYVDKGTVVGTCEF
jgi:hypothetical protein